MNAGQDLCACLKAHWQGLDLPGPPPATAASIMLKGNRKSIFLLFLPGARRPALVLKYADNPAERYRLENEYNNLHTLAERFPAFAPDLLAPARLVELPGGLGLLRKVAPGQPLTFRVRPIARGGRRRNALFDRVYTWLLNFQEGTRAFPAGGARPAAMQEMLERHILFSNTRDIGLPAVAEAAASVRTALLDGTLPPVVEHGDFNSDNIYEHRNSLYIIDWEWAKSPGLPLIDLFEFALHYTRIGAILGRQRAQAVTSQHLLDAFNPSGPLAPVLQRWTGRACRRLHIPEAFATSILTLLVARYLPEGPLPDVLDQVRPLFAGLNRASP